MAAAMNGAGHLQPGSGAGGSFRHEALLYTGDEEFVAGVSSFVRAGLEAGEPALVVVAERKIELLQEALAPSPDGVVFADMAVVGRNPARIIPAWEQFVARHPAGTPVRGIGEPISAERGADELVECQRHESLLNLAFAGARSFWLLCPYDVEALTTSVIEEARRSHPYVAHGERSERSGTYLGLEAFSSPFAAPLPEPAGVVRQLHFEGGTLGALRHFVAAQAEVAGLGRSKTVDVVLSLNEIASNSIAHGGGRGLLRSWQSDTRLVFEVRDRGRIEDPLVDRRLPTGDGVHGRGLWIANQLCDLVQVRSFPSETIVRVHVALS